MNDFEALEAVFRNLVLAFGSLNVVLVALFAYLGKVWLSRIANREAEQREARLAELKTHFDRENAELKGKIDVTVQRSVHVDRVRFEHEYQIYRDVWRELVSLREATLGLRPILDFVDPNQSEEDRQRERSDSFGAAYRAFQAIVEPSKPFYPPMVYDALAEVRRSCHSEFISYKHGDLEKRDYWEKVEKSRDAVVCAIDHVCEAIRARISEVRVA